MASLPWNRNLTAHHQPKTSLNILQNPHQHSNHTQRLKTANANQNKLEDKRLNNISFNLQEQNNSTLTFLEDSTSKRKLYQSGLLNPEGGESRISSSRKSHQISHQSTASYLVSSQTSQVTSLPNFSNSLAKTQTLLLNKSTYNKQLPLNSQTNLQKIKRSQSPEVLVAVPVILENKAAYPKSQERKNQQLSLSQKKHEKLSQLFNKNIENKNETALVQRNSLTKKGKSRLVRPLSLATPSMLLSTVKPHKVIQSDKQLPVVGGYFSNEKSKNFVIRELSSSKQRPLSVRIIGVKPLKTFLPQIVKIPIHRVQEKLKAQQDEQELNESLINSQRLYSESNETSKFDGGMLISMYKSPDVVVLPRRAMEGPKLQKNHVQKIAVEGKVISCNPILEGRSRIKSELTPLQKYFKAKNELNISEDFSLSATRETIEKKIESVELITFEIKSNEEEYVIENTKLIQSVSLELEKQIDKTEQIEVEITKQVRKVKQIDRQSKISISSALQQIKTEKSTSRYVEKTLPQNVLNDLNELRKRKGLSEIHPVWHSLNQSK